MTAVGFGVEVEILQMLCGPSAVQAWRMVGDDVSLMKDEHHLLWQQETNFSTLRL